ncbi:hypothetical protein Tco_0515160 [Tanacetum coccineum]
MLAPNALHLMEDLPFANPMYLKKALYEKPCFKTCLIPLALKTQNDSFAFVHELKQEMHADLKYVESLEYEIDELESDKAEFSNMYDMLLQECVSKDLSEQTEFVSKEIYIELLRSFAKLEKHSISLEIALQQCQEQLKNDTICKEKASNVFRKERGQYFEIQNLKAQLQDKNIAISELKKLIEKCKGKSVDTKFDKPSVVRQPNVIKPSMYQIASRVARKTNVSRPHPRSNQMKDKVLPNTSHVKFKKTEVEEHPRFFSISNQTKYVTACNDSLNSRTLNVNVVCATCGKCVFNSNHDACVSKFLNEVNARTKKPKVVPISSRKPKSTVHFGNDQFASILGYGDLVQGNIMINRVYYVEGLNHNLFSVGQFCDADLEVAFRKSTCFVRDLHGNNLLTGTSVNKSSSPTDNSKQQDTLPTTNIQSPLEPTTPINVNAKENNDNQAADTQFHQDEFINPFYTPIREIAESSSRNIDNSNMQTFYQPHDSEYRWIKDHPLEQVRGNPSKPVQT